MTYFTIGKNNIKYLGDNFKDWFEGMDDKPVKKKLYSMVLDKPMNDEEIKKEYNPSEVSLGEVAEYIKNKTEGWYVFYAKDKDGIVRAVRACWDADCGGWTVGASSVEAPRGWCDGDQFLSRDPFKSLDTWKLCKSCAENIKKHL